MEEQTETGDYDKLEELLKKGAPKLEAAMQKASSEHQEKTAANMTLSELLEKGRPNAEQMQKQEAVSPTRQNAEKVETHLVKEEKHLEKIETQITSEERQPAELKPKIIDVKKPDKPTIVSILEKKELAEDEQEVVSLLEDNAKKEAEKAAEENPQKERPSLIERIKNLFHKNKTEEEIKEILAKEEKN